MLTTCMFIRFWVLLYWLLFFNKKLKHTTVPTVWTTTQLQQNTHVTKPEKGMRKKEEGKTDIHDRRETCSFDSDWQQNCCILLCWVLTFYQQCGVSLLPEIHKNKKNTPPQQKGQYMHATFSRFCELTCFKVHFSFLSSWCAHEHTLTLSCSMTENTPTCFPLTPVPHTLCAAQVSRRNLSHQRAALCRETERSLKLSVNFKQKFVFS